MKRIFTLTISFMLAIVFCFTMLTGCALVHTDAKKDMNQVVATIKISDDIETEKIYKRDVILAYINQYYVYEQSYGYTREQVFDLIVSEMIETKVMVQAAMLYFAKDGQVTNWSAESFLDEKEVYEAKYNAYKSIDDLIDSFADQTEEEKVQDSYIGETRVVPSGAVNDEEIAYSEKEDYVDKCEKDGIEVASRRKAFNKTIKSLKANELLGDGYDGKDISKTDYFKNISKSYYEQQLLSKYEKALSKTIRDKKDYAAVKAYYEEIYNKQKEWTITEFKDALSNLSATGEPILYTGKQAEGYGRVYHILLAADEQSKQLIEDWKKANPNYKTEELEAAMYAIYFDNIKVYDKRTSWIMQGFDFDGTAFTGDYTRISEQDDASAYAYQGSVNKISADDAEKAEYFAQITEADKISVADFLKAVDSYLYGIDPANNTADYKANNYHQNASAKYADVTFRHQIEELMFAYSDDSSETALNAYKGYVISPDNAEGWSPAFWEGGKELIANSAKYGDGFVIKATEHGLHVMFLSEKYGEAYNYNTLESYLNKEFINEDTSLNAWENYFNAMTAGWNDWKQTDNYLYMVVSSMTSSTITAYLKTNESDLIKDYVNSGSYVQRFDEVYEDLI